MGRWFWVLGVCVLMATAAVGCGDNSKDSGTAEDTDNGDDENNDEQTPDCFSLGGGCVGIGECSPGMGHMSDDVECSNANLVCCVPQGACGQPLEDFLCCSSDGGQFRPTCRNGELICIEGTDICE